MRTANMVPFVHLTDVFADIERERNWEPSFPGRYIHLETSVPAAGTAIGTASSHITLAGGTTATDVSTLSGGPHSMAASSAGTSQPPPARNTMVRNLTYRAGHFDDFKAMGIRIGKLKESLRERNIKIPKSANGIPMCLAYHVLGYCNERCNSSKDHAAHTEKEDKDLAAWCKEHFKLE